MEHEKTVGEQEPLRTPSWWDWLFGESDTSDNTQKNTSINALRSVAYSGEDAFLEELKRAISDRKRALDLYAST